MMRRLGSLAKRLLFSHPTGAACHEPDPEQCVDERCGRCPPGLATDESRAQQLERDASERGFMRRDTPDAKVYMEETLIKPERISGGVTVANLPPTRKEETEFDVYQRSTRDYTSQVTPFRAVGVGLGAGFGVLEDKRLGFLRPRKLQPFAGEGSIVPKYDENGMPIDESLTREHLIQKRLAYMKSFEGTTMSHREHFLLVDLDFEKDAMIFGTTREEFERNVTRLKEVISEYSRWERTDNFYYYGTVALKLLTAWALLECIQQYYELQLLSGHYGDFVEAMEETLDSLVTNLDEDFKRAREELKSHPPDFRPVVEAIRREKRRLLDESAGHPSGSGQAVAAASNARGAQAPPVDNGFSPELNRVVQTHADNEGHSEESHREVEALPKAPPLLDVSDAGSSCNHPMDTTHEELYLASARRREIEREMRRLQEHARNGGSSFGVFGALRRWLCGGDGDTVPPLRQADFVRLSYAASPTSIDTLRAIRRILLPRSEDYTQTVREEMLEYKNMKEAARTHPN
ncbi:unnamed protein product [Trypanosoma congolense IL3000]|uniref:WGS project CAEQ00000000 data, annotated contig 1013 n=1 Tax=Trypanosoma congolense (strain IL3000) TaxID=1068625 RepID=F9W375_TRYCI|nr:unnamed protein product [Trypanosoma congolense IL3000]